MRAQQHAAGRGLLQAAMVRAGALLLEPRQSQPAPPVAPVRSRPVIAVVGLAPQCGSTTVARALAAELAGRDPAGAAAVCGTDLGGPVALAASAAGRLSRALEPFAEEGPRTVGRLSLVGAGDPAPLAAASRYVAPLVLDVTHGEPAGRAVALADHVVLVAGAGLEPALAEVVAASLARVGPEPVIAAARVVEGGPWERRGVLLLPESRAGARLAAAGREPRGALGAAVAELADLCGPP